MLYSAIASAAFLAISAHALGAARVVNSCSYPVYVNNTPSADGGYEAINNVLETGDDYTQTWTQLTNDNGWSIKLSPTPELTNIMQYEYTYHTSTPSIIWFDLSDVNGNPWNANWEVTATGDCTPRQAAYQYSTDDAYGMQSCESSSEITVTLCSGDPAEGSGDSSSSSAVSSAAAATTPTSTAAPTSTTAAASSYTHPWNFNNAQVVKDANVEAASTSSPTTLVTAVSTPPAGEYAATVTDVATTVVISYVTATAEKRHEHHPRHPHHRH